MEKTRPIAKLRDELIGMIAAGEVVENPASAVKELVENSLDAGATSVTVEIREGGIDYLRVTDNGSGIAPRDIRMAFERHATSKLMNADELFDLSTLGFRGEALASIAAVSRVTLTTKQDQEPEGLRAVCEGGEMTEIRAAASPTGTTVVARDLFYNTPVRRKFLKKPNTEAAKVTDVIARFILSRPDVSFRLTSNGKQIYGSTGSGDLRAAIAAVYGRQTAENMLPVSSEGGISVTGFVGVGDEARANRGRQTFIVNGRIIRNPLLFQALEAGCRERVTVGHYPVCVLNLQMPGNMVDVNVHPNKLEVRFSDERLVFGRVMGAVADCFPREAVDSAPRMLLPEEREQGSAPKASFHVFKTGTESGLEKAKAAIAAGQHEDQATGAVPGGTPKPGTEAPAEKGLTYPRESLPHDGRMQGSPEQVPIFTERTLPSFQSLRETAVPVSQERPIPFAPYPGETIPAPVAEQAEKKPETAQIPSKRGAYSGYRTVGILFDTYIVLEGKDQVLFVDQHAAHERILYEKLMKEMDAGTGSQILLVPVIANVTPQERERAEAYRQEIESAGYEFQEFGDGAYQIRAVPNVLGEPESRAAFLDMIDRLSELRVLTTREKRRDAILQMACKKAIKGGDRITEDEVAALLAGMSEQDAPPTCPHGRPLVITLSRQEIEKRFRRINR